MRTDNDNDAEEEAEDDQHKPRNVQHCCCLVRSLRRSQDHVVLQ